MDENVNKRREVQQKTFAVDYPGVGYSDKFTSTCVRKAISDVLPDWVEVSNAAGPSLQVSDYDSLDFELLRESPDLTLGNGYMIRKALIRKHHLPLTFAHYLAKHPSSILRTAIPRTWTFELSFADELDELWTDELYEVSCDLDENADTVDQARKKWFILKPGMADKGQGLRLFDSKEALQEIFEEFEANDDDDDEDDQEENERKEEEEDGEGSRERAEHEDGGTSVMASRMRWWVVQEYVGNPLLLDPRSDISKSRPIEPPSAGARRKFHLRAYVLASGALSVYLSTHILALFASRPYHAPTASNLTFDELLRHLTNTCLQAKSGPPPDNADHDVVRLFWELEGNVYRVGDGERTITRSDLEGLLRKMEDAIKETFRAALGEMIHFQVWSPLFALMRLFADASGTPNDSQVTPNAFEVFGLDFLVDDNLDVFLLEINACPDFAQTGARLSSVIEDLWRSVLRVAVVPFFKRDTKASQTNGEREDIRDWEVGGERFGMIKCLEAEIRRGW